jgi:dolichyl-diphosphooligosaccharide--protein glycosyltransferase
MVLKFFKEKNKIKLLLAIMLVAFAVRVSVFPVVFSNGNITFLGADTYYHARRILFTVLHFPATVVFDPYINYPIGSTIGWAPLFDEFIALIALIVGLGNPSLTTIETTTAVVPLILGVFTVLLVFHITEKLFDWKTGLIAAGTFAIIPPHVYVSLLGYPDHHVAEALLSTGSYLFFIISMQQVQENSNSFNDFRKKLLRNSYNAILCGITLALSIFTWNGAPIFIGLIGIYIVVQFLIDRWQGRKSDYLIITGFIAFLVALLIVTPVALTQRTGFDTGSYLPSLFHVGFLSAFILLCALLGFLQNRVLRNWLYYPIILIAVLVAMVFLIIFSIPQFYQSIVSNISYLFGGGVLGTIQEAVPLLYSPGGKFTLDFVWHEFSLTFFIAIFSVLLLIIKTKRDKYQPEIVFFIVWTLIVLTLTLLQRRFIYLFSVNVAILTAYLITFLLKTPAEQVKKLESRKYKKGQRPKEQNISSSVFSGKRILAALIIGFIIISFIQILIPMVSTKSSAPDQDYLDSFRWLRDNSPPTSGYDDPDKTAEYGIMSWWDYGNWILYISRRPVVANNFQTGIEDASGFFTESDENAANHILDKRKVRYVITDAPMLKTKFNSIAMLAGKNPDDYYDTKQNPNAGSIQTIVVENDRFFKTMLSRLHVFDGDGLGRYRLVYESSTRAIINPDIKFVKIFEYVPGAVISGSGQNNMSVKITLDLTTNQGRSFTYSEEVPVENGRYVLKVPYSTEKTNYGTQPAGAYIIQNGNFSKPLSVKEEAVLEGREIMVDLN